MNPDQEPWAPCPEGELGAMVGQLRQQRRNFLVNRAAAVAAVACMALVVVGLAAPFVRDQWFVAPKNATAIRPISCREVHDLLPRYARHELDPELTRRIDKHLEHCRPCRRELAEMANTAAHPTPPGHTLVASHP
jgi:predicted anti-sigma-YlaC factor YlaD